MVGKPRSAPEANDSRGKLIPSWHFTLYGVAIVATALLAVLILEIFVPGSPQSSPDLSPVDLESSDGGHR